MIQMSSNEGLVVESEQNGLWSSGRWGGGGAGKRGGMNVILVPLLPDGAREATGSGTPISCGGQVTDPPGAGFPDVFPGALIHPFS